MYASMLQMYMRLLYFDLNAYVFTMYMYTLKVKLFSYQCSQHSTPATIIEVFSNAKRFQESKDMKQIISVEKKNTKQFVSVVVLDEVGLAEDSPSLPLKALHPLLEDGTSGADAKVQVLFNYKIPEFLWNM